MQTIKQRLILKDIIAEQSKNTTRSGRYRSRLAFASKSKTDDANVLFVY